MNDLLLCLLIVNVLFNNWPFAIITGLIHPFPSSEIKYNRTLVAHVRHHIRCLVFWTTPTNLTHLLFLHQSHLSLVLPEEWGPLLWMPVMMITLPLRLNLRGNSCHAHDFHFCLLATIFPLYMLPVGVTHETFPAGRNKQKPSGSLVSMLN
jgi:hypothetical protein